MTMERCSSWSRGKESTGLSLQSKHHHEHRALGTRDVFWTDMECRHGTATVHGRASDQPSGVLAIADDSIYHSLCLFLATVGPLAPPLAYSLRLSLSLSCCCTFELEQSCECSSCTILGMRHRTNGVRFCVRLFSMGGTRLTTGHVLQSVQSSSSAHVEH
jgi:hypothetical protein